MKKDVVGIFASSFDAMKAIDSLKHDGIDNEHICVVANNDLKSNTIENKTGVAVEDDIRQTAGQNNLWEQLKSFFTKRDAGIKTCSDHLLDLGLTEADVDKYANEVDNGHILVLVDSDVDRGRTGLLSTENIPVNNTDHVKVHGETVDNFTTGDRFDRKEHSPQARTGEQYLVETARQAGRPKERAEGMELRGRKREFKEEVNPFENRYKSGYTGSIDHDSNDQQEYNHNPS
ncbi:putative stress response protein [Bacillus freudenreichii]|nr:putative stress response protein [Bacillus freudenreichii]